MNYFSFSIMGQTAGIMSASHAAICRLRNDFSLLSAPWDSRAFRIKISLSAPPRSVTCRFYLPFKPGIQISPSGKRRVIRYCGGNAWLLCDFRRNVAIVWSRDIHLAHEIAYLTVLSRLGTKLDDLGYHRVHALALKTKNGAALLLGDSGAGKTTIAVKLARTRKALLYSDDFPLTDRNGIIYPFPARLGLQEGSRAAAGYSFLYLNRRRFGRKLLVDFADVQHDIPSPGQTSAICIIGKERTGEPHSCSISRLRLFFSLFRNLAVGIGLPQIAELIFPFSPGQAWTLTRVFYSRLKTAWRLSGVKRRAELTLCKDAAKSAGFIMGHIENDK